ncbi:MAG TPA: glycosyltransferase [Sedimentisphaerales bacterium]|nr:glycosyltransferase [Sedimentisphaerales bacterium]
MSIIRKAAAHILLISVYGFTYIVALLGSIIPRRPWRPTGRIMVTGTFHNPNWYLSHVTPLSRSGINEVILVVDEPQLPLERVSFVCPPRWISRLLSRAGAKAIWMIIAGIRYRPDLYMGYHIAPGACSALVAGKLLGRPSCYQMTGGPVEIIGGGFGAIESVGNSLGRPSKLIETLALAVVRLFDLIVVRGGRAKKYLESQNIKGIIAIITGSVNGHLKSPRADRGIHSVFVGRLVPIKQVEQFITIVEAVAHRIPSVRAAIVGDGPLLENMKAKTSRLGLTDNIEFLGKQKDVKAVLDCSKTFVLTSKSEGLSIAMIEAMTSGVVPVVADVGELRDLVTNGVNGYLVEPNRIDEYTKKVISLLQDPALWEKYSLRAIEAAKIHCDVATVSKKWQQNLQNVVSKASGVNTQKAIN